MITEISCIHGLNIFGIIYADRLDLSVIYFLERQFTEALEPLAITSTGNSKAEIVRAHGL